MNSLETIFTGIAFPNPFVLSSSPSTVNAHMIKKGFAAGWGGAVLKTIGLEPTPNPCPRLHIIKDGVHKTGMVNIELISDLTLEQWVDEMKEIRDAYPDRPVIASIMGGGCPEDWQTVIQTLEPLGVNGFEANVSCPNFAHAGRGAQLGQDPESLHMAVSWIREATTLPVWVKLTPNVGDITALARVALDAGADAVIATNTLSGLAGIDLEDFTPQPAVKGVGIFGGYSGPGLKAVSLRCAAAIARTVDVPLAGCGGISRWSDAAEYLAVGAGLVEVCTAVMWNGYGIIEDLTRGLEEYLEGKGMGNVGELVGKALPHIRGYADLDLSYRERAVVEAEKCNGCGRCREACDGGGFEAIHLEGKLAVVDEERCDGCGLCLGLCPTQAIRMVAV